MTKLPPKKETSFDASKCSQKVSNPVLPNWVPPVKMVMCADFVTFSTLNASRLMK